jgi:hypothetical protein
LSRRRQSPLHRPRLWRNLRRLYRFVRRHPRDSLPLSPVRRGQQRGRGFRQELNLLPRDRRLRHLRRPERVLPCRLGRCRRGIADRFPERHREAGSALAGDHVPASRCDRCSPAVREDNIRRGPVARVELEARPRIDLLNNGADRCPLALVRGLVLPDVPGCCPHCRRTKRRRRRSLASRSIRVNLRRGSGRSWTSGSRRVSASCTLRASVRARATGDLPRLSLRRRNRARRAKSRLRKASRSGNLPKSSMCARKIF